MSEQSVERQAPVVLSLEGVGAWRPIERGRRRRFARNESLNTLIELGRLLLTIDAYQRAESSSEPIEIIFRNVSLEVRQGQIVGILDVGGIGRTTLAEIMAGARYRQAGQIRHTGTVAHLGKVSFLPFPFLTCRKGLMLLAEYYGLSQKTVVDTMAEIIEFSGLGHVLDKPIRRVTKSEFQDLAISMLVCCGVPILVADDAGHPSTTIAAANWRRFVARLPGSERALILTGRRLQPVIDASTHLVLIDNETLLDFGPTAEMLDKHPEFVEAAITRPVVRFETYNDADDEEGGEDGDEIVDDDDFEPAELHASEGAGRPLIRREGVSAPPGEPNVLLKPLEAGAELGWGERQPVDYLAGWRLQNRQSPMLRIGYGGDGLQLRDPATGDLIDRPPAGEGLVKVDRDRGALVRLSVHVDHPPLIVLPGIEIAPSKRMVGLRSVAPYEHLVETRGELSFDVAVPADLLLPRTYTLSAFVLMVDPGTGNADLASFRIFGTFEVAVSDDRPDVIEALHGKALFYSTVEGSLPPDRRHGPALIGASADATADVARWAVGQRVSRLRLPGGPDARLSLLTTGGPTAAEVSLRLDFHVRSELVWRIRTKPRSVGAGEPTLWTVSIPGERLAPRTYTVRPSIVESVTGAVHEQPSFLVEIAAEPSSGLTGELEASSTQALLQGPLLWTPVLTETD